MVCPSISAIPAIYAVAGISKGSSALPP